jgi:hypothetical protein
MQTARAGRLIGLRCRLLSAVVVYEARPGRASGDRLWGLIWWPTGSSGPDGPLEDHVEDLERFLAIGAAITVTKNLNSEPRASGSEPEG